MAELSIKLSNILNELLVDDIKVVSFDVFDTLLLRPCLQPTDVFLLVEKRLNNSIFKITREYAEIIARKNKPFYQDDITIDDIYREYQMLAKCSNEEIAKLMNMELSIEKELLKPRYSIKSVMDTLKKAGKKIIITSDMYLPREFFLEVLEKNEISNFDNIYISSEEKLSKGTGRLFQKIIVDCEKDGIKPNEIAHLGDNRRADVDMPSKLGIKTFFLPKPSDIISSKQTLSFLTKYSYRNDDTFLVGVLANYLFDDPYREFRIYSYSNGEPETLATVLYGPLLMAYSVWILKEANRKNINQMLMVYRDGYIFEKIFKVLSGYFSVPKLDRIYLSRSIRYLFYGNNSLGLIDSFQKFPVDKNMTVREFITNRLLFSDDVDIDEVWSKFRDIGYNSIDEPMGEIRKYISILPYLSNRLSDSTSKARKNVENYVTSIVNSNGNIGVLDVGYRGSVAEFLWDNFGIKTHTFQLFETSAMRYDKKKELDIDSFCRYGIVDVDECKILHQLTEDIISKQEGTALLIERDKRRYKVIKKESTEFNQDLDKMQKSIVNFCEFVCENLGNCLDILSFDNVMYIDFLMRFLKNPCVLDANNLLKLSFEDSSFISNNKVNAYEQWYFLHGFSINKKIEVPKPSKDNNSNKKPEPNINKNDNNISITQANNITNVAEEKKIEETKTEEDKPWEKISKPHLYAIKVCEHLGLINQAVSVKKWLSDPFNKKMNQEIISKVFESPLNDSLDIIKNCSFDNPTIVAGAMASFDKGICSYLNSLDASLGGNKLMLLSEANPSGTKQKVTFNAKMVPKFAQKDIYEKDICIKCDRKIKSYVRHKAYLKWAYNNMILRNKDISEDYAYCCVYYMDKYVRAVVDIIKPKSVIIWNEFFAYHHIWKNVLIEQGVKYFFMEFGSIPGTVSFERIGQMGKSYPAINVDEFTKLPVSAIEINNANRIIDYLKTSKINRNVQPITNEIMRIKEQIEEGKPTILYAGVNDYESGLVPYTNETKKYHSPFLKSSDSIIPLLSELGKKNGWNIIYKPHPLMIKLNDIGDVPDNVILAKAVDINEIIDISDVVVTILSQVSYISLIREKALVMLGYTQLKEKGCCYEAFSKNDVETKLKQAIMYGFTDKMKQNFDMHIAQMIKYNLYYDGVNKECIYGRTIDDAKKYIEE